MSRRQNQVMEQEDSLGVSDETTPQETPFYADGAKYWEQVEPTVNGMLGGYAEISDIDLQGSQRFLNSLYQVNDGYVHCYSHITLISLFSL